MRPGTGGVTILLLLVQGAFATLGAQEPGPTPAGPPAEEPILPTADPEVLVRIRPNDAVVAISLRIPVGTASDPDGMEGTAFLAARLIEEEGTRRLEARSARVEAAAEGDAFLVTAVGPAGEWEEVWSELTALLEGRGFTEAEVLRLRDLHGERLRFEAGAPVREFERERAFLLLGSSHPAARPATGSRESLEALDPAAPLRFLREHVGIRRGTIGIVGPVEVGRVADVTGRPTALVRVGAPPAEPLRAAGSSSASAAWTRPERVVLDRDITSTWIAVAWPLPAGSPHVLEDFLAHVVSEALNPSPPDPGLYRAQVEVVRQDGMPVLLVNATVDPRVTLAWEERILSAVAQAAESPPPGAFFELARRRYRAARLLEHAAPEAEARWIAVRGGEDARVPEIASEVWGLTREALAGLASERGEPRILIFGPVRMIEP